MKHSSTIKVILVLLMLASQCLMWGSTRRGLVIGLGEYQDRTWGKIHGDMDVPLVKDMLGKCGYTDVTALVNKQATKAGIISAFSRLTDRCRQGDMVYIHFSGHGQQITDTNGDEDDGWDEAWIPYDAQYAYSKSYKGENHLIDDEIAKWLRAIKSKIGSTGKILLVVDACHSGDSDRGTDDDEEYTRGADDDFVIPLKSAPKKTAKAKEDWMAVTACKNVQNNCEVKIKDGEFYGILSYALYSNYRDFRKQNNESIITELQRYVNLKRKRGRQTVTILGNHSLSHFFN